MHEAGKLFHAWGVALGQKLEIVLKKKKQSLPSVQEEEGKKGDMLEDEMEEDFLDEGETLPMAKPELHKSSEERFKKRLHSWATNQ